MLMDHISECAFCLGHPVEEYNVVTSFEMTDILLTQTKQQQSVERESVPECCKKRQNNVTPAFARQCVQRKKRRENLN